MVHASVTIVRSTVLKTEQNRKSELFWLQKGTLHNIKKAVLIVGLVGALFYNVNLSELISFLWSLWIVGEMAWNDPLTS